VKRAVGYEQASSLLARPDPLDALRGEPALLENIRATFGEALTPAQVTERIVKDVRSEGDSAVVSYTSLVSHIDLEYIEVPRTEIASAAEQIDPELLDALKLAAGRVRQFHERCRVATGTEFFDAELGRKVLPLHRVGLYVPGGRYAYPSSVLMSAIPAHVAGVTEIVVATPPGADGSVSPVTLAACHIAGVHRVFAIGGAQAIAALAYGTESVPRVDKICGPGNVFVTLAKKMVFGSVAIDSLAGPSEVLIVADSTASPAYCAADILAQAEHDPQAGVAIVTTSAELADAVEQEIEVQLATLERRDSIRLAVDRGLIAVVDNLDIAIQLSNEYGPEHLELVVSDPTGLSEAVKNAGCICLGGHSPVVMGDYVDGPSHVLPTGGSARFSSVLGIHDFLKYSSIARLDSATMADLGPAAITIARAEGLEAHARAVEKRLSSDRR